MHGRDAWRDNVFLERFWRSIKYEEVYLRAYDSVTQARSSISRYVAFHNGRRPHTALDGRTPDQVYFTALPVRVAAYPPAEAPIYRRGNSVQTTGTPHEAYAAKTGPMIRAAGERFLVRGIPAEVFEAGQKLLTVVIEFESVPATTATYNDPAYQDCVKLLRDAVVRDIRIVEGAG